MTVLLQVDRQENVQDHSPLRRGWTTGSCAAAAAKAAWVGLCTGVFPDPVDILLPGGQRVAFALAETARQNGIACAGVVKDAGDDPDVTHGALIRVRVWPGAAGQGVVFRAGAGVGTVTRAGLPVPPGEPAINPVPRRMITQALHEAGGQDVVVEVSVQDGEHLAQRTLNGRLGIVGGLSILGTTGIVVPFSCAAWIDSIHRGIDVARAAGLTHVAGATGHASERAVQALYDLPEIALIEMGDFVGGMLKYLRTHPVARVTLAGGVAKMTKLAQGRLDLHSKRGLVDMAALAELAGGGVLGERIVASNTVAQAFAHAAQAQCCLGERVATQAWNVAAPLLAGSAMILEIAVFDRQGVLVGQCARAVADHAPSPRNRR